MIGKVPDGWKLKEFLKIFKDDTAKKKKIPTNDYLKVGNIPVIDQGQKAISGYTNDIKALNEDQPIIIFGDHTRAIKYVDFNFAIGADGVKVLKNIDENSNTKYLYYTLLNSHIPNTGYNRHFKYLKRLEIPIPPLHQQEKIVKILDLTSSMIENQKELLKKYDLFLKSKFIEMFGDPISNPMGWKTNKIQEVCFSGSGGTPSRQHPEYYNGNIPWIKSGELNLGVITQTKEHISEKGLKNSSAKLVEPNSVLVAMYGATVGVSAITKIRATTNQAVCFLNPKANNLKEEFLLAFFRFIKNELVKQSVGGGQPNISQEIIKNTFIIMPPIELQNQFASIVEKIESIKTKENEKLKGLEELHGSLMQKAFQGKI